MKFKVLLTFLFLLIASSPAQAVDFDIYQSDFKPLQIAWHVSTNDKLLRDRRLLHDVVENDLLSSQSFVSLNPLSFIADPEAPISDYADWRIIGADVFARCNLQWTGRDWVAEVQIHAPFRQKLLSSMTFKAAHADLRRLAHRIANLIYHTMIGVPGHFDSNILYVTKRGDSSNLIFMNQDGANLQTVGRNFTLLLSPDWSPGGNTVALNTYVGNRPRLEIFDLTTGSRQAFGAFKGLNSTPEFSPDGRYIAATLSYTGNSEIHIYDTQTGTWRQFTHHPAIDTTPTWSPDGKWIAFTSNRNGTPQIYRKALSGGQPQRISLDADYNTSPVWSPKGDRIAFITKKDWSYALATVNINGSGLRYLATGQRIESPTWSPNGQMLLYSAGNSGLRRIYRVPSWGGKAEAITAANVDASDPAWSRQ